MKVLIGIPLYNEQAYLKECISSLFRFIHNDCTDYDISVLLVDDGSTDRSRPIYEKLATEYSFQVIKHHNGPLGYGKAMSTLFHESRKNFDILITFDADLQHDPPSIGEILTLLTENPKIDLVSTSRYLSYRFWSRNTQVPVDRYITNMYVTKTINTCFPMNNIITDAFCGLKGYRTNILPQHLEHTGYSFPLVFWNYCHKNNVKVQEIETPIIYRLDRRARGEWKVRLKDYYSMIGALVTSLDKQKIVKHDYQQGLEHIEEIVDHHSNFPILTYSDFFKSSW
ncbi:MAG: glycosyltransferase family 2 protein [Candidatus Hodarchaeales archaeon]